MEIPLSSIQSRVEKIKRKLFCSDVDLYSFVCPSAYDTAWLAIIPDSQYPSKPMFKNYLDWLLNNQKPEGFWGESDASGKPTIESLPATLISMVALKKWNTGKLFVGTEHRTWIEEKEANALWKGKAPDNRVSYLYNDELLQLATRNFDFKQSLYKNELKELKRWAEDCGISNMGFGREKTTYCYFAVAAATSSLLPHDSYIRMLVAKSAIIITVADDFFDMIGSITELEILSDAVGRWDSRGLSGHSKVIFDALDNVVSEVAIKYLQQEGSSDISDSLKDLRYETFLSWLIEAKWSRNRDTPSIDCYLKTGMISIATHNMVLPASCFLNPSLPTKKLRPIQYEPITELLMVISRLLNDIGSYEKEKEDGKLNSVLVNLIENSELDIEVSIAFVREIIEKKKKEFLEHVLIDGLCDLPKPCKQLHLSCLKVFQMFFNSKNRYDSNTEMVEDINKAIYLPLTKPTKHVSPHPSPKKSYTTIKLKFGLSFKQHNGMMNFTAHQVSAPTLRNGYGMMFMVPKIGLGFI